MRQELFSKTEETVQNFDDNNKRPAVDVVRFLSYGFSGVNCFVQFFFFTVE